MDDPVFCTDAELGYLRSATRFSPGESLRFDEPYRLAHLPLIAPRHGLAISRRDGAPYRDGRHAEVFSLIASIPETTLQASAAFQSLQDDVRRASFAPKIAWDIGRRRQGKLHATICGSLSVGSPPNLTERNLAGIEPFWVELHGLFSGNVNLGRLYLKAYPEKRRGHNAFQAIQSALARKLTDLYPVGLYNFIDEPTASETLELAELLDRWRDTPLVRLLVKDLQLLGSHDDLVLESRIVRTITLSDGTGPNPLGSEQGKG